MSRRVKIDCSDEDKWEALLEAVILKGWEADLVNFDFKVHGPGCVRLAERRNVVLLVKPKASEASVRCRA